MFLESLLIEPPEKECVNFIIVPMKIIFSVLIFILLRISFILCVGLTSILRNRGI